MSGLDTLVLHLDRALRTVAGVHRAERASPAAGLAEGALDASTRAEAAALMRVNHVGEVCAQALYQGQALTAREPGNRRALAQAALEEQDHLVWSAERIGELDGRTCLAIDGAWRSSRKPNTRSNSICRDTLSGCQWRTERPGR